MDDKKKSGLNAFAGRKVGGSDKYREHHLETLRHERAIETTDRINQFYAQNKTLEWARRAFDFCDREQENGVDIADICEGLKKLPLIRSEAQSIIDDDARQKQKKIDDENARIHAQEVADAQRKRQLELLQKEQDLKNQADEAAYVANVEKLISSLSGDDRTRAWVESVKNAYAIASGLPQASYNKIKNRHLLEDFVKETALVEKALDLDAEIIDLQNSRTKSKAWADKVFKLEKQLDGAHEKYLTKKENYYEVLSLAGKVFYAPQLATIEGFLKKIERGDSRLALDDYSKTETTVEKLREAIYIDEYIDNFEIRWTDAQDVMSTLKAKDKKAADAERARLIEEEKARKKEQARLEEIDRQNEIKRKQEIARKKELERKKALARRRNSYIIMAVSALVVLAGSIIGGIFTEGIVRSILFGGGCSVGALLIFAIIARLLGNKGADEARGVVYIVFSLLHIATGIACIFLDASGIMTLCVSVGVFAGMILNLVMSIDCRDDFENDMMFVVLFVNSILLSAALYMVIPSIWGGVIGAVIILTMAIVCGCIVNANNPYDTGIVVLMGVFVATILGALVAMFFSWGLFIMGVAAVIGCIIPLCVMASNDVDGSMVIAMGAIIIGIIVAFIAVGIHCGWYA